LSILKTALALIKQNHGLTIDIDTIPLDDEKTFKLFQQGETNATFQFESAGMQKYLRELKPDKFDDLIAMNALFRPGPMGYIPQYIARKHGREMVLYDIADMQEYLEETYGITVYQEQVMLLSQKLADFSKGDADILRKAMGKKQKHVLDKMKVQFLEGATAKGHPKDKLEKIWTDWEAFAQYAFNKSHSTCYAFVAYQTAYLKAHYPSEFMAAVLNHAGSIDKITFFMEECKRMGLTVLGPDINESHKGFAVNKKGEIRFGFSGLKGVGEAAIENIIEERKKQGPFSNVFDLVKRVNLRAVNKKTLESLVYSGSFDSFKDLHRAQYFYQAPGDAVAMEKIIKFGQVIQAQSANAANTLFGDLQMPDIIPPKLLFCEPWQLVEQLDFEKEITGIYMSGHPLDNYKFELKNYHISALSDFNEIRLAPKPFSSRQFRLAGLVTDVQHRLTKKGKNFGILQIEDFTGKTDMALFGEDYVRYQHYLDKGIILLIEGQFRERYNTDQYEFRISKMHLLDTIKKTMTQKLSIGVGAQLIDDNFIAFMSENVSNNPGNTTLNFKIMDEENNIMINLYSLNNKFTMNDSMAAYLEDRPYLEVSVLTA